MKTNNQKKTPKHRPITKNYRITLTVLTHDLSASYITSLLEPETSYQLIPGFIETLIYDVDQCIIAILPYSKNKLIDLCLPIGIDSEKGGFQKTLGRYLLFNQKIVGIRICTSNWTHRSLSRYKLPPKVLKYLKKQSNNIDVDETVPIGDFMFTMRFLKFGLLFESQILHNTNLLKEHYKGGCQIFSVICDVQKTAKQICLQSIVESKLKQFAATHKVIVLYSGMKIVNSMLGGYTTNSFAYQKGCTYYLNQSNFAHGSTLTILADTGFTKANKTYFTSSCWLQTLHLPHTLPYSKQLNQKQELKLNQSANQPLKSIKSDLIRKMYLWYVYNNVNGQQPFYFSIYASAKFELVISLLIIMEKEEKLGKLFKLYSLNINGLSKNENIAKLVDTHGCINAEKMLQSKEAFHIYSDNQEELNYFRNDNRFHQYVVLCGEIIPQGFWGEVSYLATTLKDRGQGTLDVTKIDKVATDLCRKRFSSINTILIELSKKGLTVEEQEYLVCQAYKQKLKMKMRLNSLALFIINASRKQLELAFKQAEIETRLRVKSSNLKKSRGKIEEEEQKKDTKERERSPQQEIKNNIRMIKKHKERQHEFIPCHSCGYYLHHEWCHKCMDCMKTTCLQCKVALMPAYENEDLRTKCYVCIGACNCRECKKPMKQQLLDPLLTNILAAKETENTRTTCSRCEVVGRPAKKIEIICAKCQMRFCYACMKSPRRQEWLCNQCQEPQKLSKSAQVFQMVNQTGRQLPSSEISISNPDPRAYPQREEAMVDENIVEQTQDSGLEDKQPQKQQIRQTSRYFHKDRMPLVIQPELPMKWRPYEEPKELAKQPWRDNSQRDYGNRVKEKVFRERATQFKRYKWQASKQKQKKNYDLTIKRKQGLPWWQSTNEQKSFSDDENEPAVTQGSVQNFMRGNNQRKSSQELSQGEVMQEQPKKDEKLWARGKQKEKEEFKPSKLQWSQSKVVKRYGSQHQQPEQGQRTQQEHDEDY